MFKNNLHYKIKSSKVEKYKINFFDSYKNFMIGFNTN